MRRARTLATAAAFLSILLYRSGSTMRNTIIFKTPLPVGYVANGDYSQGTCRSLGPGEPTGNPFDALSYCEDAAFWDIFKNGQREHSRLVYAACDANLKSWFTVLGPLRNLNPRGSLWVYDPSSPQPQKVQLKNYPEGHDFHPLGFEIYPSTNGEASNLYVVNHARARTVIEQFTLEPSNPTVATHIRTISSPYFISPNSIALTSPNSFYVSNDHLFTRRLPFVGHILPILESVLAPPLSFVSHITLNPPEKTDSPHIASHTFAALFLSFANGVSISSSGRRFAVASSSLAKVFFYARDPTTNVLTPLPDRTVSVPFCPDNLRFTRSSNPASASAAEPDTDELIIAGHPHFPSLSLLAKNKTGVTAGSWVVSAIPTDTKLDQFDEDAPTSTSSYVPAGRTYTLRTLFQSNGGEGGFTASATGLLDPDTGALYVSGLYADNGVIECRPYV